MVELLVSAGLSLFVLGVVYSVYRVQTRTVKSQESRWVATEDARAVLDMMVREIRNTGYNPRDTVNGASCAGTGNPAGAPGVVAANAQTLQFTLDADGDGDCGGPNEDITYNFAAGNITRAVNGGAAQNLTNGNATVLQFTYFPQNCTNSFSNPVGTGAAPCPGAAGGNAGTLAAIQRVLITLTIQSTSPDTEFGGGQLSATMVSNVDLRNRGLP